MPPPRNFNTCFLLGICYNHARTTSMMSWQSHRGYFVTDPWRKKTRERLENSHQVKYCAGQVFRSVCARLRWILKQRPRRHNIIPHPHRWEEFWRSESRKIHLGERSFKSSALTSYNSPYCHEREWNYVSVLSDRVTNNRMKMLPPAWLWLATVLLAFVIWHHCWPTSGAS